MKLFRLALGVLFLVACAVATVSAQPPPDPNPVGGAVNSITITTIDTATKGQVNLGGVFTTQDAKTTLTVVEGSALPTSGGEVGVGGGAKQNPKVVINNQTKLWTSVIIPNLTKQSYSFRVEGTFSAGPKVCSAYQARQVDGDVPPNPLLTINWTAGFPKSTQALKISSQGTYTGTPDIAKFVYVTPFDGGQIPQSGAITSGNNSWSAADVTVTATPGSLGATYVVFALINGTDGTNTKTYCSPYATVYVGN